MGNINSFWRRVNIRQFQKVIICTVIDSQDRKSSVLARLENYALLLVAVYICVIHAVLATIEVTHDI